jgi:phosphopantothenoylcysteine decarboxylase/phosphopantothenate--cysteine ligase
MGIEIAKHLKRLGAEVTLIHGPTAEKIPRGVNAISITSADEMASKLLEETRRNRPDAVFAAAAITDYKPSEKAPGKIDSRSQESITIKLVRTSKVIQLVREASPEVDIIAFRAVYGPVEDPVEEFRRLQSEAGVMMVVINDISRRDVGFGSDLNDVTIVTQSMKILRTGTMPKREIARIVVDTYLEEKAGASA